MRATLFLMALLMLAACNPAMLGGGGGAQVTTAIQQQEQAQLAAITAKNAQQAASFYAADGQLMLTGQPTLATQDAIRGAFQQLFDDPAGSLTIHGDNVIASASGDYAISTGTFSVSYTDTKSHTVVSQTGPYVTVWHHQPDNSWKIVRDISTPGGEAPPAAPTPGKQL